MTFLRSIYHFCLAHLGALVYRFPSRDLMVIGVTGTKGKSSTTELINAILEEAGHKTAVLNSIRIKVADDNTPNTMRMSMPGRFYIQRFLSRAKNAGCTAVVIEMTSEGARQHRHRGIQLDALVFTNLAPEHIESHGSLQAYADAKFSLGKQLARSKKRFRVMVANADDPESARYLALPVERSLPFSLSHDKTHGSNASSGHFTFNDTAINVRLPGEFSLQNALAAATLGDALDISTPIITRALGKITRIPGRAERIDAGQDFTVVVDYAHTAESLKALYDAYKDVRKICVLGATGGGRDRWKRPVMGKVAEDNCDVVILTNEDPYEEDPKSIVDELGSKMQKKPLVLLDRRKAMARAFEMASEMAKENSQPLDNARGDQHSVAVLITGKGTDPTIQGPKHTAIPWSDAAIAREELNNLALPKV